MNYIKYAQDNQKKFGYKIVNVSGEKIALECSECGAKRTILLKSLYKNKKQMHNQFCSKYYLDICKKELGNEVGRHFHDFYRMAKERCCNPNNKDYNSYRGRFKFNSFSDFYLNCFDLYKEAVKKYHYKDLSIDRINGKLGYEKGNIRFVPMYINLQNKEYVKPVKMTNVETEEVIHGVSLGDLARKYKSIKYVSVLHRALQNGHLYKKIWKVEYDM